MFTKKPVKITTGFSLKRVSLLTALALLSPAALPADRPANSTVVPKGVSTEPLNINYTRTNPGGFNTFGANFCHVKSDPFKIHVVVQGLKIRPNAKLTLTVEGKHYVKNYAALDDTSPVSPSANKVPPDPYGHGYNPTYTPYKNKDKFVTDDFVNKWGINFFANSGGESQDGGNNKIFDYKYNINEPAQTSDLKHTYVLFNKLKTNNSKIKYVYLNQAGTFDLTVKNRNITRIELHIEEGARQETLTWTAPDGESVMSFRHTNPGTLFKKGRKLIVDQHDPYDFDDVYTNIHRRFYLHEHSYFKGTLVSKSELKEDYDTYIKEKMPLSLPAKNEGELNLLNTEELQIRLDGGGALPNDRYLLIVGGVPLKFVPLYVDGAEKISAMRLRNACK